MWLSLLYGFHGVDSCESMRMALFVGDECIKGFSRWLAI